ncbi:MAG: calcium-binding protein, partial [Selenomonadaceae bacterium]|nr:calcium-binding protein [Selenomonadaceae bacterium]
MPKVNVTDNYDENKVINISGEADAINYVNNGAANVTINGSEFNDYVSNGGNGVNATALISLGAGNDSIYNFPDNSTLLGGDGDDWILNNAYFDRLAINVSIDGGAGNDYIETGGWNTTISGGTGDDDVHFNDAPNPVYIYTGGNDTIYGMTWGNGIIVIEGYNWSMSHTDDGDDTLHVDVLDDNNSVVGTLTVLTWNRTFNIVSSREEAEAFSNFIQTDDELNPITGTSGNDYLVNGQSDKTISAGDGDDWINHIQGTNTTINAGAGDDKITNWFGSPTINAGAGDDVIENWTSDNNVTMTGGTGNDTIYGAGGVINYADGDGDDVIDGFGENSTLAIASDTYSTKKSGDDIIVTVGEGHLTLVGASWMSSITVVGGTFEEVDDGEAPEEETASWKLNGTTATYGLEGEDPIVTVNGVKSPSGLSIDVDAKTVTVGAAALNESTVTISDGYTLVLSKSAPQPSMQEPTWTFRGTVAICQVSASTAGYMLEDNQIKYVEAGTDSTIAIDGVTTEEGIEIDGTTVTISKAALNGSTYVSVNDGYTLALARDVDKPIALGERWTYNDGTAIYTSSGMVGGYKLVDNQIIYVADKSSEHVEISGVTSREGITRSGDTFTIPAAVLNQRNVTISDGYTLALARDVQKPTSENAGWTLDETTATYQTAGTTEGYSVDDDSIVYTAASGRETLVTVSGVKSTKGLYLNDEEKVVTVYRAALNETNITISDGYTLELDA